MLSLTQQYKVLGGRDRACSLLGLLSKANGSAPSLTDCAVDYMKTLSQLYLDVAKKIVEQDGSLSKLGCIQHFDSSGHLHTPSRVPQRHYSHVQTLNPFDGLARADVARQALGASVHVLGDSIRCYGIVLDIVTRFTDVFENGMDRFHPYEVLTHCLPMRIKCAGASEAC